MSSADFRRRLIAQVLEDCEALGDPELAKVMVLLRRFDAEAAQQEARELTKRLFGEQKEPLALPKPVSLPLHMAESAAS
jgi:hypothetical protein